MGFPFLSRRDSAATFTSKSLFELSSSTNLRPSHFLVSAKPEYMGKSLGFNDEKPTSVTALYPLSNLLGRIWKRVLGHIVIQSITWSKGISIA